MMQIIVIVIVMAVAMTLWLNWIVTRNARVRKQPTIGAALVCLIFSGLPLLYFGVWMIPLIVQAVLLFLALATANIPDRGPRTFRYASIGLTAVVWLIAYGNGVRHELQYAEWREQYPIESMAERMPEPKPSDGADDKQLQAIEDELPRQRLFSRDRDGSLRAIHEDRVRLFLRAAGFGAARMLAADPNPEHFEPILVPVIPQSEVYNPDLVSLGDAAPADAREAFGQLHMNSLLDFVNADGFGYVKDRTAVAGFRPHGFSRTPAPVERRSVTRVDLIGLVKHDTPKVYLSESLPRMEYLSAARTREPDPFEAEGLKALRGGEDLFARGSDRDVRMIGAIRSVSQCVECHGGKRGDLLGAFTYRIWKMGDAK
jgi:hypothetical protein